jgi:hypothetical protein
MRYLSDSSEDESSLPRLLILSCDRVNMDGFWIYNRIYLDSYTTRDYTSQITITHRPVFSVTLLGNGF